MHRFAAALFIALASLAATAADPAVAVLPRLEHAATAMPRIDQGAASTVALTPAAGAPVNAGGTAFVISSAAGGSMTSGVVVVNRSVAPVTVQLHAASATIDSTGAVQLAAAGDPSLDGASWVELSSTEIVVPASGTIAVPFTLAVPAEAPAGPTSAAIVADVVGQPAGSSAIMPMHITVTGTPTPSLGVSNVAAQTRDGHRELVITVTNSGGAETEAQGRLDIAALQFHRSFSLHVRARRSTTVTVGWTPDAGATYDAAVSVSYRGGDAAVWTGRVAADGAVAASDSQAAAAATPDTTAAAPRPSGGMHLPPLRNVLFGLAIAAALGWLAYEMLRTRRTDLTAQAGAAFASFGQPGAIASELAPLVQAIEALSASFGGPAPTRADRDAAAVGGAGVGGSGTIALPPAEPVAPFEPLPEREPIGAGAVANTELVSVGSRRDITAGDLTIGDDAEAEAGAGSLGTRGGRMTRTGGRRAVAATAGATARQREDFGRIRAAVRTLTLRERRYPVPIDAENLLPAPPRGRRSARFTDLADDSDDVVIAERADENDDSAPKARSKRDARKARTTRDAAKARTKPQAPAERPERVEHTYLNREAILRDAAHGLGVSDTQLRRWMPPAQFDAWLAAAVQQFEPPATRSRRSKSKRVTTPIPEQHQALVLQLQVDILKRAVAHDRR